MHIRFIGGRRDAARAVAYVLGAVDSAGLPRPGIEILRGEPGDVARVADDLSFKHKYSSAVISWAPEDAPTDAHISETLDEFERVAWAGLAPERRCWTAVLHREDSGGCHLHVLAARVDLATGRSLNIAPPRWQEDFDPLRDWLNERHGWGPARRSGTGAGAPARLPGLRGSAAAAPWAGSAQARPAPDRDRSPPRQDRARRNLRPGRHPGRARRDRPRDPPAGKGLHHRSRPGEWQTGKNERIYL